MESFNFKNIKAEKANAILRYKRLHSFTTLFRVVEICIFLVIISRFVTQFSFVSKLSGEKFRELSLTLISPRFVFVIGNAIVIVLLLESGQSSAKDNSSTNTITDFHDDYMKKCVKNINNYSEQSIKQGKQSKNSYSEQSLKQGKQSINNYSEQSLKQGKQSINNYSEQSLKQGNQSINNYSEHSVKQGKQSITKYSKQSIKQGKQSILGSTEIGKKIHKSRSENFLCVSQQQEEPSRELRRSTSVVCRKNGNEMSSEEFRQTVESFIARQQRLLREEEFSADDSYY